MFLISNETRRFRVEMSSYVIIRHLPDFAPSITGRGQVAHRLGWCLCETHVPAGFCCSLNRRARLFAAWLRAVRRGARSRLPPAPRGRRILPRPDTSEVLASFASVSLTSETASAKRDRAARPVARGAWRARPAIEGAKKDSDHPRTSSSSFMPRRARARTRRRGRLSVGDGDQIIRSGLGFKGGGWHSSPGGYLRARADAMINRPGLSASCHQRASDAPANLLSMYPLAAGPLYQAPTASAPTCCRRGMITMT